MNYQTLRAELLASSRSAVYAPNVVTNDMPKDPGYFAKDSALADAINSDPTLMLELVSRPIKRGDFLRALGPIVGSGLFSKIKTAAANYEPLSYIVAELEGDGLTINEESQLSGFIALLQVNTSLDAADLANINAVFHEKHMINAADISIALRNPL